MFVRTKRRAAGALLMVLIGTRAAAGQQPATAGPTPETSMARDGSGTSWLPDSSPMYMWHGAAGGWGLSAHENAFVQYLHDSGARGVDQAGSINWVMGMAERRSGQRHLAVRGMFSAEPWTVRGCGYPNLLQSGERCAGAVIHDRQHPHDLFMEIAAEYDAPLAGGWRWQIYGGPAGEPALGPTAFPHRPSAMPNPLAPISHHWLDSTHVSFGVVTAGVYGARWKIESSAFNGREPDERRTNIDLGLLDSLSGRVWFLPTPRLALQASAGHLAQAEAGLDGAPRRDVNRVTASATYQRLDARRVWASTVAWGRNAESGEATHALLAETAVTLDDRDTWYGRFEVVGKPPGDLAVPETLDVVTVAKLEAGYTRYVAAGRFRPGIGIEASAGLVPGSLRAFYGGRVNAGVGVYLTLRPRAMPQASGGSRMVMVQTALDPAKLTCDAPAPPGGRAHAEYRGTTYYFCSARDRDAFLQDPAMSLSMMPPRQ
ncbi:MAG TPA: hypothetical protein VG871_22160 [Vicinamibacterales bacterium]|nr:hypothetical protein [Vicinamibacterales bacterium]